MYTAYYYVDLCICITTVFIARKFTALSYSITQLFGPAINLFKV